MPSDTHFVEDGSEWPRSYMPGELIAIAQSIGHSELPSPIIGQLQEAVKAYQWGRSFDEAEFPPGWKTDSITNKGRRKKLKRIVDLCKEEAPRYEIQEKIDELDGPTSQRLAFDDQSKRAPNEPKRAPHVGDHQGMLSVAEPALSQIPLSGPDPKRARLEFICALIPIFEDLTQQRATRRVHVEEEGPFRDCQSAPKFDP